VPIIYIFRDKYLDLPPFWSNNCCSAEIKLSSKPSSTKLVLHVKEAGYFDWLGGKYNVQSIIGMANSVKINDVEVIHTGDRIEVCKSYEQLNAQEYMNSPASSDVYTVCLFIVSPYNLQSVRYYVIFDLYLEIPETEPLPEKEVIKETGGTGQGIDNVFLNIFQFIQTILFIIPLAIIFNLISLIMPRK